MILVLTHAGDTTADTVCRILELRGATFVRFDPASFPLAAELSVAVGPDGKRSITLEHDGAQHDLSRLTAVWCRRPGPPAASTSYAPRIRDYLVAEAKEYL